MFLIRHSTKRVSRLSRPTLQALRATPPTCVNSSSSSHPAGPDHGIRDFPGAVATGPTNALGGHQEDRDAEMRKAEASLSSDEPRSEPTKTPSPSARQPSRQQHKRDWRRPQIAPGAREYLRFVRIFGLSANTTFADILAGIAQTAPVGRVLSIQWDKKGVVRHREREVKGATVLFDHDAAAADLVRLAKQQTFLVRGEPCFVSIWAKRAFHGNDESKGSRVIHISGPRYVENFSVEGIRDVLLGKDFCVKALGPLGLNAEDVVTMEVGGGRRLIEWRFLDSQKQATIVLFLLRRVFYKKLSIDYGPDPCWDEQLYPRGRTGHRDARFLPAPTKDFKKPTVRDHGRVTSKENISSVPEDLSTRPSRERDQVPWGVAKKHSTSRENPIPGMLQGHHKTPLPLDERQQERVAAWTQLGRLAMENTQDDNRHNGQRGRGSRPRKEKQKQRVSVRTKAPMPQDGRDNFQQLFKRRISDPNEGYTSKF